MTRQMADDEVLRVLKRAIVLAEVHALVVHADELNGVKFYVAALQAERDALRAEVDGSAFVESTLENAAAAMTDLRKRAERAESALEALRGQVAGLVEKWQAESNALPTLSHKGAGLDRGIKELSELLAIKERMG